MFQVGDVVVCVEKSRSVPVPHKTDVSVGVIYKVLGSGVYRELPIIEVEGLDAVPWTGYRASRFKLLPKADPSFTEQMRSLKPKVDA